MTVIAIDGPAGSGKSTLARLLAERLGFAYLDTGAMYRAVAFLALREGVALDDGASLAVLAREAHLTFAADGRIVAADHDASEEIRRPAVSAAVSEVSAHAEVRAVLLDEQRRIGAVQDVVIEGRDIGTVVAPNAEVKVYLVADRDERARRRMADRPGIGADALATDLRLRDEKDAERMKPAEDAREIDTTGLNVEDVVERIEALVRERTVA